MIERMVQWSGNLIVLALLRVSGAFDNAAEAVASYLEERRARLP